MKEIPNLDELLNSFIDGELAPRQHTEVQRLVAHDEKIAQRLKELEQCKMFLSSLPVAEAPPRILENVKASLAGGAIMSEEPLAYDEKIGARHLNVGLCPRQLT
jgi:anti-sigma factor RsiW